VQIEDLLDERHGGDAAVALDDRADPGCLGLALGDADVRFAARQAHENHERDHDAGREPDEEEPEHPGLDHRGSISRVAVAP
jgi:hypothetical protein